MNSFQIPTPCHENWDKMTPVEKGRHCQKCVKTVHDVTNWSDEKIIDSYNQNNQNLCIRIPTERLTDQTSKPKSWKYYLAAGLATFLFMVKRNFAFAQAKTQTEKQEPKDTIKQITSINLTGVISDSLNQGNPIIGADVIVYKDDKVLTSTYSDNQGRFKLELSDSLTSQDSLTLSVHYVGMKPVSRRFNVRDSIEVEILMSEGHICMKETVIMRRRRIMTGTMTSGIMWRPNKLELRQVYRILDDYDTKHIHNDELERLNLRH